jgi:hypothetical protein
MYSESEFLTLKGPRIDSKEQIPPGCVAWRADTTTLFLLGTSPHRLFKSSINEEKSCMGFGSATLQVSG